MSRPAPSLRHTILAALVLAGPCALGACSSYEQAADGPTTSQGGSGAQGGGGTTSTSTSTDDPNVDHDADGYTPAQGDCNDSNPNVHPGAPETCDNGIDDNCNGAKDGAEPDADGDGFGPCQGDCNDADPTISPVAPEVAGDNIDNNCDGITDGDFDGDGYTVSEGDCNDDNPEVYPGAPENCYDNVDNNCNGAVDAEEPDADGDGYGPCQGDCNDQNANVHPGAAELPNNGIDDNCDNLVDEDIDGDGWTVTNGDCNDNNPTVNPGAKEICADNIDNDCNGITDSDCIDPCKVNDDMNAIGECDAEAPPNSFEPDIQWSWTGPNGEAYSIVTPLVANLTDDDNDGDVDLCDIPDIVVVASSSSGPPNTAGHIYVLDGATGALHFRINDAVDHTVTPAIGDIDNDGLPEIVTGQVGGKIIAFENTGALKFVSATAPWPTGASGSSIYSSAVALGDANNDGQVEIASANWLADHNGNVLFTAPQASGNWSATALADLDDDGDLELVLGNAAYHHDGTQYYYNSAVLAGYPQIADLDGDGLPEVLVMNQQGITLLENDGTIKYADQRPTGDPTNWTTWLRPATVHDFDGDGAAEFAVSSANHYTVYEGNAAIRWTATVSDQSGIAAGTAFDFLGSGVAEAMYADESHMFIFGGNGETLLQISRTSGTLSEYPVVADVDNDGSAEIVVVSNQYQGASPTVQVIRDIQDRWIQARRIWNQHTYHVTNVREDGTIPQFEVHSWAKLNTFRTNAQIEGGGVCVPIFH
jgi:hypothetical protein